MIRLFNLRDIPLVARLENSGVPLCNELALVHGLHPLRLALTGYFSLHRREIHTCVAPGGAAPAGFAQMRSRGERGVMMHIAPSLSVREAESTWCALLDNMAATAGAHGLQHFIAEAPPDGAELDVLRRAGFVVYLRQDVLWLVRRKMALTANPPLLREATPLDTWAVQQLYYNTVPRLAQLAETAPCIQPSGAMHDYVLEEAGEVTAYLQIRRGPGGAWFNVMIHPQAETCAQQVLEYGLVLLGEPWHEPVYCCVRRYQEWLWEPLLALEFKPFISSVVLVKRLVAPIAEPEPSLSAALEAHAHVTSPVARAAPSK